VQKLNPSFTDAGIRLRTLGQETFQDRHASFPVMAGLVPAIPMLKSAVLSNRDHRHKAGDDTNGSERLQTWSMMGSAPKNWGPFSPMP
jgi:hypothetical protein